MQQLDLDTGLARELAAFTERTGIQVELTSVDPKTALSSDPGEPDRRPDVMVFNRQDPRMGPRPRDRHRPVRRPRDPAIRLRRLLAQLRNVGQRSVARLPETGQFGRSRRRSTRRASCSTRKPSSRRPGTRYRIHGTSSSLSRIKSWRTGEPHGASASSRGDANGWPGTDFLESLVLRVGGVETYDAWTRGEIGFTSPAVMKAGRLADALVFKPGYVRGGTASISDEPLQDQLQHMLARDNVTGETQPRCWMYHQAEFLLTTVSAADQIGTDIDFFMLPPMDPSRPTPAIGTANFMSALNDRPEVREFMSFVASPEWGSEYMGRRARRGVLLPQPTLRPLELSATRATILALTT